MSIAACLFFGTAAEAGPLTSFRQATDELGEAIWGFESNCPGGTEGPDSLVATAGRARGTDAKGCSFELALTVSRFTQIGVTASLAQEYLWITEAIDLRRRDMLLNYHHLAMVSSAITNGSVDSDPAIRDELARLTQNVELMGKLTRLETSENTKLQRLRSHIGFDENEARDLKARIAAIRAAKGELMRQTPLLGHEKIRRFIAHAELTRFHPQNGNFQRAVGEAVRDVMDGISEKLDTYSAIKADEKRLGNLVNSTLSGSDEHARAGDAYRDRLSEVAHDTELVEDLLVGADPSRVKGLENLLYAGCRLENRVLKHKAMGELRGLAFNTILTVATMGLGSELAVARISPVVRVGGVVATEGLMQAATISEVSETMHRCESLRVAAYTGVAHSTDGRTITQAYQDCRNSLSDQVIMGLVGTAGSLLGVYNAVAARRVPLAIVGEVAREEGVVANQASHALSAERIATIEAGYSSSLREMNAGQRGQASQLIELLERHKIPKSRIEAYFERIRQACHL